MPFKQLDNCCSTSSTKQTHWRQSDWLVSKLILKKPKNRDLLPGKCYILLSMTTPIILKDRPHSRNIKNMEWMLWKKFSQSFDFSGIKFQINRWASTYWVRGPVRYQPQNQHFTLTSWIKWIKLFSGSNCGAKSYRRSWRPFWN